MNDFDAIARRYIDAWNATDPDTRAKHVATLWTEDGSYIDPLAEAIGHDQITGTIAAVQDQFPGWTFRLVGPVDGHHDQCRFSWELGPSGDAAPVAGSDVAVLAPDGRLHSVYGFLDRVPTPS